MGRVSGFFPPHLSARDSLLQDTPGWYPAAGRTGKGPILAAPGFDTGAGFHLLQDTPGWYPAAGRTGKGPILAAPGFDTGAGFHLIRKEAKR